MEDAFAKRIKAYRILKGATQQEVADVIGVDHTTYAHYETGRRTPDLEKLTRLAKYYELTDQLLGVDDVAELWKNKISIEESGYVYCFPVVVECPQVQMKRVYPLKQKEVAEIHEYLVSDERVRSAMLFGSSVTDRCHINSDIDLMVRLQDGFLERPDLYEIKGDISEKIMILCDWNADILWFDRLSDKDRVYQDILQGVRIA